MNPRYTLGLDGLMAATLLATMTPDPNASAHVRELRTNFGTPCSVWGCDRAHRSGGFCWMHLARYNRAAAKASA